MFTPNVASRYCSVEAVLKLMVEYTKTMSKLFKDANAIDIYFPIKLAAIASARTRKIGYDAYFNMLTQIYTISDTKFKSKVVELLGTTRVFRALEGFACVEGKLLQEQYNALDTMIHVDNVAKEVATRINWNDLKTIAGM